MSRGKGHGLGIGDFKHKCSSILENSFRDRIILRYSLTAPFYGFRYIGNPPTSKNKQFLII